LQVAVAADGSFSFPDTSTAADGRLRTISGAHRCSNTNSSSLTGQQTGDHDHGADSNSLTGQ
jgi:hypothetical protein